MAGVGNSFRSGRIEPAVDSDGKSPIQLEGLFGSHEAALGGKLRWYHRIFLSSAVKQRAFLLGI